MRVLHLGEVGSTNDHARKLLSDGTTGPLWIRADRQSSGRGRLGRIWTSEPGNLYCTGLLPTRSPIAERHRYSFAAALAVHDVLSAGGVSAVELKWPNDVLVAGRKIAGILLESDRDHLIVGIGLNLAHHPEDARWPATHTAEHGWSPDVSDAFEALTEAVDRRFAQSWTRLHRDWLVHACCIGEAFEVRSGHEVLTGTLDGLGPEGELLLRTAAGMKTIVSGDIAFRDAEGD